MTLFLSGAAYAASTYDICAPSSNVACNTICSAIPNTVCVNGCHYTSNCGGAGSNCNTGAASCCTDSCTATQFIGSCECNCNSNSYLNGGSCLPKKANGQTCTAANQCTSGNCVDGYCCNSACTELCKTCAGGQYVAGSAGTCSFYNSGYSDIGECVATAGTCLTGGCNGQGSCGLYTDNIQHNCNSGYYCNAQGVCTSEVCTSGTCCNTAANPNSFLSGKQSCGTCQTCSGSNSACQNIASGSDPNNECSSYTCANYVLGWYSNGNSCYAYPNGPTALNGNCNGNAACSSFVQSCTSGAGNTLASCGVGCKNTSACISGTAISTSDSVSEVCFTDEVQHSCSSGYACDNSGNCIKDCSIASGGACAGAINGICDTVHPPYNAYEDSDGSAFCQSRYDDANRKCWCQCDTGYSWDGSACVLNCPVGYVLLSGVCKPKIPFAPHVKDASNAYNPCSNMESSSLCSLSTAYVASNTAGMCMYDNVLYGNIDVGTRSVIDIGPTKAICMGNPTTDVISDSNVNFKRTTVGSWVDCDAASTICGSSGTQTRCGLPWTTNYQAGKDYGNCCGDDSGEVLVTTDCFTGETVNICCPSDKQVVSGSVCKEQCAPPCPSAATDTVNMYCNANLPANAHFNNTYVCTSGTCTFCNSGYKRNAAGVCVDVTAPACDPNFQLENPLSTSGHIPFSSTCTDNSGSRLIHSVQYQMCYQGICGDWNRIDGASLASGAQYSDSINFCGSTECSYLFRYGSGGVCDEIQSRLVKFKYAVTDSAGNSFSVQQGDLITGICCNDNMQWSLATSQCCWSRTGIESESCSTNMDCCDNICSNGHCCPEGKYYYTVPLSNPNPLHTVSGCYDASELDVDGYDNNKNLCINNRLGWLDPNLFELDWEDERWHSGTPYCIGNGVSEYFIVAAQELKDLGNKGYRRLPTLNSLPNYNSVVPVCDNRFDSHGNCACPTLVGCQG
jgi:hypothetical protein